MRPTQISFTACSIESCLLYHEFLFRLFWFWAFKWRLGNHSVKRRSAQSRFSPSMQEQFPRFIFAARKRAHELEPPSNRPRVPRCLPSPPQQRLFAVPGLPRRQEQSGQVTLRKHFNFIKHYISNLWVCLSVFIYVLWMWVYVTRF